MTEIKQETISNEALLQAMQAYFDEQSNETVTAFVEELLRARFLAPVMIDRAAIAEAQRQGQDLAKLDVKIQMVTIEDEEKKLYFPAFTDPGELERSGQAQIDTVVTNFDQYCKMILEPSSNIDGFVINPFGESFMVPRQMLSQIQEDFMQSRAAAEAEIVLQEPLPYPTELVAAINEYLATQPNVEAAYLQLMSSSQAKSYLVILDVAGVQGAPDEYRRMAALFDQIAAAVSESVTDIPLSFLPIWDDFGKRAAEGKTAFYSKE